MESSSSNHPNWSTGDRFQSKQGDQTFRLREMRGDTAVLEREGQASDTRTIDIAALERDYQHMSGGGSSS